MKIDPAGYPFVFGAALVAVALVLLGHRVWAAVPLVFVAFFIETNAGLNMFTLILFTTMHMGIYSIICGTILPAWMAVQDVADACEEPFQSLIPNL